MIRFDHCYTPDPGHALLRRLERGGFAVRPRSFEHPGGNVCRSIAFKPHREQWRPYLEFVSGPAGRKMKPGFSFMVNGRLERYAERVGGDRYLLPRLTHRNYDWKTKGESSRLPGFNFLEFGRPFEGAEVWFTEYEPARGRAAKRLLPRVHANSCDGIVGFRFELDGRGRRFFERLLRRDVGERVTLADGTDLYFARAAKSKFSHVILRASRLETFVRLARPEATTRFQGREAAVLKNPAGAWDILVIGR